MLQLLELRLKSHPILGELSLNFTDSSDSEFNHYVTVLIGPNGTGKSYILQSIINSFRDSANYNNHRSSIIKGSFYMKFKVGKDVIEVGNVSLFKEVDPKFSPYLDSALIFRENGNQISKLNLYPKKILASTMVFTDKYPAVSDAILPQYEYLGLRNINSPSTAGTRGVNSKIVASLVNSSKKEGFIETLAKVLTDLKYVPKVTITYTPKYRTLFYNQGLSESDFLGRFSNWKESFKGRKTEPWGKKYLDSIKEDNELIKKILLFLNDVQLISSGRGGRIFEINLLGDNKSSQNLDVLFHLHKLDLISFPSLHLVKQGNEFGFSESSSGEQNIMFSLLTILGSVEDCSIVIVDEPELSLHPNWQMQYFKILNDVFKGYKNIHFIVATHSHFLISDLKGENSKIVGLKRENGSIEIVPFKKGIDTYGWSAEDVLYRVFSVRTTRNYFMEMELRELLHMISEKSNEKQKMEGIINRLEKVKLNQDDPLNLVLEKAKAYIEKV